MEEEGEESLKMEEEEDQETEEEYIAYGDRGEVGDGDERENSVVYIVATRCIVRFGEVGDELEAGDELDVEENGKRKTGRAWIG